MEISTEYVREEFLYLHRSRSLFPVTLFSLVFSFFPPFFLKPERYQQSSKSGGFELSKSQISTTGTDPKSCVHAFSPGTQAEHVFSRNVSLGVESLKMSV